MAQSSLNKDFRDLLCAFLDAGVRFLVVGAYALAVHGRPRATGDLDVWIEPTPDNARRAHKALRAFGAPLADLTEEDLATPGTVFQIGVVPRRIDVLTELTALRFEDVWPRRIEGIYGPLRFPVIGKEDFIRNKRATGRLKDRVDANHLARSRR
jgi:hypothetical protein